MTVVHFTPRRFEDARGWFVETWNAKREEAQGVTAVFCQDNQSFSAQANTLRGLHFQRPPFAQAKLVRCLRGSIFDVAVDLRRASPTYKQWVSAELSSARGNQLFIPAGYAHGFLTLEADCEVAYKVDAYYAPHADGGVRWDDGDIGITWPLSGTMPVLSVKDEGLPMLVDAEFDFAYDGNPLVPLS
ncbi:MAG: dTDP-4-dehydrorhamnose 3,5-epimerase [Sphingomonadaceae bacterium]